MVNYLGINFFQALIIHSSIVTPLLHYPLALHTTHELNLSDTYNAGTAQSLRKSFKNVKDFTEKKWFHLTQPMKLATKSILGSIDKHAIKSVCILNIQTCGRTSTQSVYKAAGFSASDKYFYEVRSFSALKYEDCIKRTPGDPC